MTVDPQVRAFLDMMAGATAGTDPAAARTVEAQRPGLDLLFGSSPKVDVAHVEDRSVPGPAGPIPVRVYRPEGQAPLPVVVFFHGGGYALGGLESHDGDARAITNEAGCVVVAVDYRLAPEHPFPAGPEDCSAALEWVAGHAAEIGGDPARLAVMGDSAGGGLAAVAARRARDRGGPELRLQVLVYPVADWDLDTESMIANANGYFLTRDSMAWMRDMYLPDGDAEHPDASPLLAEDLAGLAPALIITAELDPLRSADEAYARRLEEAGVPVTLSNYDGMIHGFFSLPHFIDRAVAARAEVVAALKEAFAR